MNSKVIINKPKICDCVLLIDGKSERIKNKNIEIPYGKHKINIAIEIDVSPSDSHVISNNVWGEEIEVDIDSPITIINIKRKWHLFKHITTEFAVEKK